MIQLQHILTPGRVHLNVPGGSKKRVLEQIAHFAASEFSTLESTAIFDSLLARERLGSTGFGNGIAIPHCRLSHCQTPISLLIRLEHSVDFDSIDGAPVDLLFVLLVPETATDEHLALLRQIASLLDRSEVREQLRAADTANTLYQVIVTSQGEP